MICNWITETTHQFTLCLASVEQKTLVVHRVVSLWNCEVLWDLWGLWDLWVCEVVRFARSVPLVGLWVCKTVRFVMLTMNVRLWGCESAGLWGLWVCEVGAICEVCDAVRLWGLWDLWDFEYMYVRTMSLWCCETVSLRVWESACFLPALLCVYVTMCVTLSYQRSAFPMTTNWVRKEIYTLGLEHAY